MKQLLLALVVAVSGVTMAGCCCSSGTSATSAPSDATYKCAMEGCPKTKTQPTNAAAPSC